MNIPDKAELRDDEFVRSSYCLPNPSPSCVMVAVKNGVVAVRDSKDPQKQTLMFSAAEWSAFVEGVRAGEFQNSFPRGTSVA